MDRFDANDDGTLDRTERQVVKAFTPAPLVEKFQEKRQDMIGDKREAIIERFDANDDGTLDE